MEPTGHYWRKIAFFAKEQSHEVRFVRTTAVKHQRELDESSSAKSDIRDAFTIGNIVREGKYIDTVIEDERVPPAADVSPCTGEDPALHRRFDPWAAGGPE